jgi:hypothetical protein
MSQHEPQPMYEAAIWLKVEGPNGPVVLATPLHLHLGFYIERVAPRWEAWLEEMQHIRELTQERVTVHSFLFSLDGDWIPDPATTLGIQPTNRLVRGGP